MANAMTYIANLGKSVTYSTVDRLKNMNPALSDFADQNEELGRVLYESVKDFKGTTKRAAKYVSESAVGEFAKEYKKAFFEDIKSGKFYNKEREDSLNTRAAGDLLADDDDPFANLDALLNDNDSSSSKSSKSKWDNMSEDDRQTSKMMDTVGNKVTNGVAMATARSAEFQVEAYRDGLNKQQKHAEFLTNKINAGLAGMNSTIAKLVEFNDKAFSVHIENSRNYYTEMTKLTRENNKLLQQLVQYNSNMYDKKEQQKAKSSTSRFSDITSGGMPSLKAYSKNVLNNLNAATGGILDMNNMFGEGSNILLTMASSPFKFIPEMIAKKIIPSAIEESVKGLNESLSGLFAGTMLKINEAKNDFNTPEALQKVLEIFGINMGVKSKSSLSTNKYNKGPMPWDGEAKMALTRVIPDYLAKILAATTGASEKFFDYETGKYRNIADLNDQMDSLNRKYSDAAASEIIEYMKKEIDKINFAGQKENYDRLIEDMHNMFETAYTNGQIISFNKKNPEKIDTYKLGITEDSAKILIPLLQNIVADDGLNKRHMMMSYNRKILENKDAQNRYMKNIEESSTSLMRNLNNNIGYNEYVNTMKYSNNDKRHIITDVRDLTERQLRNNKNPNLINNIYLVKDEYNKNIFWYLQRFAQEFATIRTNGITVNNISGSYSSSPSSSIELLDENEAGISKNERNRRIKANNKARANAENERIKLVGRDAAIGGSMYKSLSNRQYKDMRREEENFDRMQNKKAEHLKKRYEEAPAGYMLANDEFYAEDLKKSMSRYSAYLKTDADFRKYQASSKDYREKQNKYKNSLIGSIMEAESVDDRFKNIIMGVDELSHKPAEFLAGIIGKVDKRLFNIVYGDEDDDKLSPKSFMGNLISRLTTTFANFTDFLKDDVLDPLKETLFGNQEDSLKNKIKDFFKDENVKQFLKDAFGDKIDFVKDAFKEKYGDFMNIVKGKEADADKISYAQDIINQAKSENAIREAKNEIGGALPPGATFKLDENGMPIKNSKGGYEFIADPKQLANKANRINNFTTKKHDKLKKQQQNITDEVMQNHAKYGIDNKISTSKSDQAAIERQIGAYEDALSMSPSPEEAKFYKSQIKELKGQLKEIKKTRNAKKIVRNTALDQMDANGIKNGRMFGVYMKDAISASKERAEGKSEYETEMNNIDSRLDYINKTIQETRQGLSKREKKAIKNNISKTEKELKEVNTKLSNPNLSEEEKISIKDSIKKLTKKVKYINKKLSNKDISEEEATKLNEELAKINKQIQENKAKLINPELKDNELEELNNLKSSLELSLKGYKNKLNFKPTKTLLTNKEKSSLQNKIGGIDSAILSNKYRIQNEDLSDAQIDVLKEAISQLESEKNTYRSKLNKSYNITVEDRDKLLAERRNLKSTKKELNKKYWNKQNKANFNALGEMFDLGMSGQDIENKGYGGYVFRSDRFRNDLSDKLNVLSKNMNSSRDKNGNITDIESAKEYHRYNKIQKWLNNMDNIRGTGLFAKGKDNFAYGGEITKTGIAAVSEGELIIPSEFNPYYKGSNNKLSQLAKENQAKKNFAGFLNSLRGLKADKINRFSDAGLNSSQNVDDGIANIDNVVHVNVNRESKQKKTGTTDEEAAPHKSHKKFSHQRVAEMADLLAKGFTTAEIAQKYDCTEEDVTFAINNAKLGAGIGNSLKDLSSSLLYLFKRSGIEDGVKELADTLSDTKKEYEVTDEDKKKLYEEMYSDVSKGKDKYIPAMIGGAVTGAGISLITGAIGGPLLGAAVGAATNLVTKSKKVQDWLFGDYNEAGERKGNILSKDLSNNIEKYLPSMAKSATVGGILGILPFTPGGAVSGIVLGSALGFAKKNQKIQEFIFGNDEDMDSGVISKNTREFLQAHIPEAIIGAIGGAFFMPGPVGIVGKMMIGGALGFVSQTEKFQDALFGKVNEETGEREGGLIGVLRDGFVRPLVDFGKNFGKKAKNWIKEDILDPLTSSLHPLFRQGTNMARSIFNWMGEGLASIVAPRLGGGARFLGQRIAHKSQKVLGAAGKIAGVLAGPVSNMASAPFRTLGAIGDHFRKKQIQNGDATYMTAEERNTYRDEMLNNVVYDKYTKDEYGKNENGEVVLLHRKGEIKKDEYGQRIVKKHMKPKLFTRTFNRRGLNTNHGLGRVLHPLENPDKFERFDRDLVDMSKEDLESMKSSLDILTSKDKMKGARDKAIDNVNDLFTNQFADRLGFENTNKIRKILKHGNGSPGSFNKIIKVINNSDMSDTDRAALKNSFLQKFSEYRTVDDLINGKTEVRGKMYEKLRKLGLTDISDKNIGKYKDLVNQELKIKNKMGIEDLNANQDKRHKEIIDVIKEAIEAIEHINDPNYINKKRLENYKRNSKAASKKQGLYMFGITNGTDIADAKNVSIDENGNYVYTGPDGVPHIIDSFGRDAETGEVLVKPGNNYTLGRRGLRAAKSAIKAPFRNFWRNSGHTLRSDLRDRREAKNIRKAGNYYSSIMNIDDIESYLGDDIKDIIDSEEYNSLNDDEKKEVLNDLLGKNKAKEYSTKHGIGKFLLNKKKKMSRRKINKLYNKDKEKLSDFFQKNNIGDGTEDLDDENVRNELINKYALNKEEEDTKTVSDFMGNPVEWVKNAKGSWVQKKSSSNKLTDKLQLSLIKPIDAISSKISDLAADTKDAFSRFFHLDEEDGWGKKILKIGGGILGALTVAGFMPILENYWTTKISPGIQNFWDNNIYPKIEKYVAPIKPTIAKAAIGIDAAIRSIPSAIENLGNRIRGFIVNDLPVIWAQKIIPFYQGGIDWIANKSEKIAEGVTTLVLNIAPKILKGIFKGVRKWWTTDLVDIFLNKNGEISSMGSGDKDDIPELKDVNDDAYNTTGGLFENIYSLAFGETAQQTLNRTNTLNSSKSVDTATKNYYEGDDTDYPYDDVRYSSAGLYETPTNNKSNTSATVSKKANKSSNNGSSSLKQYSDNVYNTYNNINTSDEGYLVTDNNTRSYTTTTTNTVNMSNKKGNSNRSSNNQQQQRGFIKINGQGSVIPYEPYGDSGYTDYSSSYNNNYQQEDQSSLSKFSQSVYNTYNKMTNDTVVNTIDRNGNTDIEKGTPGFVGRKGKINYFDYGFETDSGYILDKNSIIINKKNCLVYNKSNGNFIPNIFYDPKTKQFTNVPTKSAEDTYKKSMNSLSNTQRYYMPNTLQEMHDEELISGYNKDMSLYKNSIMLSQTGNDNKNLKVSDPETDKDINKTTNPDNSIWGRFTTKGIRNILIGNTEKTLEWGKKASKFGGKVAKASAVAAVNGKLTRLFGITNGLAIKTLGLAAQGVSTPVLWAKNKIKEKLGMTVASEAADTAAKKATTQATSSMVDNILKYAKDKGVPNITEDTAEKITNGSAAEAIEHASKRSAENRIAKSSIFKKIKEKILNSSIAKKYFKDVVEEAGAKYSEAAYRELAENVAESVGKAASKGVAKGSVKVALRGLATFASGGALKVLFAGTDFYSGWKNAVSYLGLTDNVFNKLESWQQLALKFISGLTSLLLGLTLVTSLIPPELIIGNVATILFKLLGADSETYNNMRQAAVDEIANHNKKYGTNYSTVSTRDYNDKDKLSTKIKKAVSDFGDNVSNFFGLNKKEEKTTDKAQQLKNNIDKATQVVLSDNSDKTYESELSKAYKENSSSKVFNSAKKSAKGSGLIPSMNKLLSSISAKGSGLSSSNNTDNLTEKENKLSKLRNDNYNKYSYNNLSSNYNESIAKPVNNIELPNTSSLFNESATGSGLPEESNVVDLNDEYVEYSAPAYTGRARKSSAKGSSLVNNTNNYDYLFNLPNTMNTTTPRNTATFLYDKYSGGASKKLNTNVKMTKENMYIDGVTDTERSENMIDDLIYSIALLESSASFAGCNWQATSQGSIGVGIFQWRGIECKKLLYSIAKVEGNECKKYLGDNLYNIIIKKRTIKGKNLDNAEKNALAKLLATETGKDKQLNKAHADAVNIVKKAKKLWINPKVILLWGMIYKYSPLVAKDLIDDNRLNKKVSINYFFNVFSTNYDLYKDNKEKWNKAYNIAMASPVIKVSTSKWDKDFVSSQMGTEYNELDEGSSNPITRLYEALKQMGEAWLGLYKKDTVEATNIDTSKIDAIDGKRTNALDPYTESQLSNYVKEIENESHYLKTRLKYVRAMIDIDKEIAVDMIDNQCKKFLKLFKLSKEGKKYINSDNFKEKAKILNNNKLASSINSQFSKTLNNPNVLSNTTDSSIHDSSKRLKGYTTFIYYYISSGNQKDAKKLNKSKSANSFKGVFNVDFVKNILSNNNEFINKMKSFPNRKAAIKWLREYREQFLKDLDSGKFISNDDIMYADLRNSFKTLGNTRKGLSAKERSWDIAEAILSSLSDTQRKSLVNNLGKEYGVTDFDFMLDARNKGNASQINGLYNSSPLRKSASVISYSEWLNKNKVIDSMDNYKKYIKSMKSKLNVGSIPGIDLTSTIDTISGKYRGKRVYQTTNTINPYTFQKNLKSSNLDAIDKIYEKAVNNTKSSINKPMSFKLLSKGLFNSLTGNALTRDDEQYGEYAKVLISDDLSKGEIHNAFKTYYTLWKKIPENVGGPFLMDNEVNWNELMHTKARYDVYKSRNADKDNKNDVPTNILQKAREQYEAQYDLAKEIVANGPTSDPDVKANADITVNKYLDNNYAKINYDGTQLEYKQDGTPYYLNSHKDKFSDKASELLGEKDFKNTDGYDIDEIHWIDMNRQISSIAANNSSDIDYSFAGIPSDIAAKIRHKQVPNLNPYTTYYSRPSYPVPENINTINKLTNGTASIKTYEKYKQWCKANGINVKGKNTDTSSFNTGTDPVPTITKITKIPGMVNAAQAPKVSVPKKGTGSAISVGARGSGFISQLDYCNAKFADGESVAEAGCGPAVAAMAIQNLRNKESAKGSNLMAATTAIANKYKNSGGTQASYFKDVMSRAGANTSYTKSSSEIKSNLKKGEQVVLMGRDASNKSKAKSPFGPNNHYVLATGIGNGKINVSDPEQHSPRVYSDKILRNTKLGVSISGKGSGTNNKLYSDLYTLSAGGSYPSSRTTSKVSHEGIAAGAKKYRKTLENACIHHGISTEWVDFLLSMMTRESHGSGTDPMQAAEGVGNSRKGTKSGRTYPKTPNGITNATDSCYAGVYELKDRLRATGYKNPYNAKEILDLAQGYNYGGGYITWLKKRGEHYTLKNAIEFGKQHSSGYSNGYGTPNHALKVWDTYKTTKSGKKAASGKYGNYVATAIGNKRSSSKKGSSKKGSSKNSTWLDKINDGINQAINSFLGLNSKSSSSSSSGSAKSDGTWISTVKAVKKAYVNAKLKYKYGGSGTIKINGKKKKVKTDCSGFVSACLREYGVKVSLTSRDFLGNVKALKKAGFTKMKWPGWSKLHKGDIIARNGHVEIFSNNKGSSHRVWNFGSSKSDHVAGTTTSSYKSYSAVWRPPSGKGSGLLLSGMGSGLDLLVAKGSNKNTKYVSDYEYMENYVSNYEDMEDIESNEDSNEAKGSNISNSQVYNYLLNRDNYNSYNSNYKSSSTPIKYNKPASSKAYKSIDKYVKTNSIKLSNEAVNNASNKSKIMSDIIKSSAKGSKNTKTSSSSKSYSTNDVINRSVSYIQSHKISNNDKDDIKVLLHAILSLEAVTANNSYDINTIVKLLKKIVDNTKESKASSGKGSSIKSSTNNISDSVKSNIPSKEKASSIINTVNNSNNSNNKDGDDGLSGLISNLQYIVSK